MPTPNQVSVGAAALQGIQDKLGAIIYLLNTGNMTAEQIASGASQYGPLVIQDQLGAIIYLLTNFSGGGGGSGGVTYGPVNPTNGTTTGGFYINTAAGTGWVSQTNGTTWTQIF
jgi:hypothetical protein